MINLLLKHFLACKIYEFCVFTSSKGRLKGYIQVSKPGLCSQNIDHYNFIGVTNDPSNLPLTILVGRLGWGRLVCLHVLTYLMFYRGFPLDLTSSRVTACSHAGRQALLPGGLGTFTCMFVLGNFAQLLYLCSVYR